MSNEEFVRWAKAACHYTSGYNEPPHQDSTLGMLMAEIERRLSGA